MFEHLLSLITTAPITTVYLVLLFLPFIENFFPITPNDFIIMVAGTLIGKSLDFFPVVFLTFLGSEAGFLALYYLGTQTDKKFVRAGKLKFISADSLLRAESWFNKYGFFLILCNRFFPGLRSVVAFFAGLSELPVKKTIISSTISSYVWALSWVTMGMLLRPHIAQIDGLISRWGDLIMILIIAGVAWFVFNSFFGKRKAFEQR